VTEKIEKHPQVEFGTSQMQMDIEHLPEPSDKDLSTEIDQETSAPLKAKGRPKPRPA